MRRRQFMQAMAAGSVVGAACQAGARNAARGSAAMPAIFVAHGSPQLLDDRRWVEELRAWSARLPRPRAILMLSAHWEAAPFTLGATTTVPLIYDFFGFPDRYYQVAYRAPGAPDLARHVTGLVAPIVKSAPGGGKMRQDAGRGLDHGAYVPLVAMYPQADVPVLQASLPSLDPRELFALGRALAPLRREGVLVMGSGFLTHNMREGVFDAPRDVATAAWAAEFDQWCAEVIRARDVDSLLDYKRRAPGVARALPTHEHFVPLIAAVGAAADGSAPASFPITGWMAGTFTRRSVQLGG